MILLLLIVAATVSLAGITAARYIWDWSAETTLTARKIYFTSDLLKDSAPVYKIAASETEGRFTFELRNYADALRNSERTVGYTVSAEGAEGVTVAPAAGTIEAGSSARIQVTVPLNSFIEGKANIHVTASADGPYAQTLTGVFELYQPGAEVNFTPGDVIEGVSLMMQADPVITDRLNVAGSITGAEGHAVLLRVSLKDADFPEGAVLTMNGMTYVPNGGVFLLPLEGMKDFSYTIQMPYKILSPGDYTLIGALCEDNTLLGTDFETSFTVQNKPVYAAAAELAHVLSTKKVREEGIAYLLQYNADSANASVTVEIQRKEADKTYIAVTQAEKISLNAADTAVSLNIAPMELTAGTYRLVFTIFSDGGDSMVLFYNIILTA